MSLVTLAGYASRFAPSETITRPDEASAEIAPTYGVMRCDTASAAESAAEKRSAAAQQSTADADCLAFTLL